MIKKPKTNEYSTALTASQLLPDRPINANKGSFGKVLVIAGSESYPGAAYFCSTAISRVGGGLVTLSTTKSVYQIVARKLLHATFLVLPDKNGVICEEGIELVKIKIPDYDVILLGPGLSQDKETIKFVTKFLKILDDEKYSNTKLLIDADGLNILSKIDEWWKKLKTKTIITPHPGEMSRLSGLSIDEIQEDRAGVAAKFAKKWDVDLVLKGAETVIAGKDGRTLINPFSNPLLATAGTGDILGGMIAGFLGQGLDLFDSAVVAAYIHGLAGELLKKKIGDAGALPSDLLFILPRALKTLKEI